VRYPRTRFIRRILGTQLGGEPVFHTNCPTQVDVTDGTVTYTRWTLGTDAEHILKQSLDGTVWTYEKGYGEWASRALLDYAPVVMGG